MSELKLHRCCFTGHRPDKMELGEKEIDANLNYIVDVTMIPNNPQCRLTFAIDENGYIRYTIQYGADECRTLPIPKTFIKWDKMENIIYNFMNSY